MSKDEQPAIAQSFPVLARLLGPHSVEAFFNEYWEKAPLFIPVRAGEAPKPLVSLPEMDAILTSRPHKHPTMQIVSATQEISVDDYTDANDYVDPTRAARFFARGGTIILNNLDESARSVRDLCTGLEAELGIQVQANTYFTPEKAQGFPAHFDTHDVIVVQCVGKKTWRLYDSPKGLPMRGERYERANTVIGPKSYEVTTGPGEALYIPRGLIHDAVAADEGVSLHVTLGFHAVRWSEVVLEVMATLAAEDPGMRAGIPLGVLVGRSPVDPLREGLKQRMAALAEKAAFELVHDKLIHRFAGVRKEALEGIFHDAVTALGADTVYATRPNALVVIEAEGDAVVLSINGRSTRWPGHAEGTLRAVFAKGAAGPFKSADLGDELDDEGRNTLLRRLLSEGAVRIAR